jgi:hypothetical protein
MLREWNDSVYGVNEQHEPAGNSLGPLTQRDGHTTPPCPRVYYPEGEAETNKVVNLQRWNPGDHSNRIVTAR